jgi:hypothetical protein
MSPSERALEAVRISAGARRDDALTRWQLSGADADTTDPSVVHALTTVGRLTVNFHPDRVARSGVTVAEGLARTGRSHPVLAVVVRQLDVTHDAAVGVLPPVERRYMPKRSRQHQTARKRHRLTIVCPHFSRRPRPLQPGHQALSTRNLARVPSTSEPRVTRPVTKGLNRHCRRN